MVDREAWRAGVHGVAKSQTWLSDWSELNYATHYQKIKQSNQKRSKQLFLQRRPAAAAKLLQSCPTLCDPIDGSPPGSPIPGILQARILEWVDISFSNAWKWKVKVKSLSRVRLSATSWTAAYQVPPSMGFSRQEYWNGVPLPSPKEDLWMAKKAHEKMFNITNYYRNAHQNSNEVSPHSSQDGHHQKIYKQ